MKRAIRNVYLNQCDAHESAGYLREQKRNPRIYPRCARAENLTIQVWVVVADVEDEDAQARPTSQPAAK